MSAPQGYFSNGKIPIINLVNEVNLNGGGEASSATQIHSWSPVAEMLVPSESLPNPHYQRLFKTGKNFQFVDIEIIHSPISPSAPFNSVHIFWVIYNNCTQGVSI